MLAPKGKPAKYLDQGPQFLDGANLKYRMALLQSSIDERLGSCIKHKLFALQPKAFTNGAVNAAITLSRPYPDILRPAQQQTLVRLAFFFFWIFAPGYF